VISRGKESVGSYFDSHPELEQVLEQKGKLDLLNLVQKTNSFGKVKIVYQDEPKGLGHAVLCAKDEVGKEPFLVSLGDDLIDANPSCSLQMVQAFKTHGKAMVAVQEVEKKEVNKYGIIDPCYPKDHKDYGLDPEKRLIMLKNLVEKPDPANAPSLFAIIGRYLLPPEIFPVLEKTQKGSGGEIQLTDGLRDLNQMQDLLAYRFKGQRFDAGDKLGYIQANLHFGLKHAEIGPALKEYLKAFYEKNYSS
jgi:UTP--glucose-1-phosphate uridylyltransferase